MKNIDVTDIEFKIVTSIIDEVLDDKTKVYAFGSRSSHTSKRTSDLDLAIDSGQPISIHLLTKLNSLFDESPLNFKVDIIDLNSISEEFLAAIKNKMSRIR